MYLPTKKHIFIIVYKIYTKKDMENIIMFIVYVLKFYISVMRNVEVHKFSKVLAQISRFLSLLEYCLIFACGIFNIIFYMLLYVVVLIYLFIICDYYCVFNHFLLLFLFFFFCWKR